MRQSHSLLSSLLVGLQSATLLLLFLLVSMVTNSSPILHIVTVCGTWSSRWNAPASPSEVLDIQFSRDFLSIWQKGILNRADLEREDTNTDWFFLPGTVSGSWSCCRRIFLCWLPDQGLNRRLARFLIGTVWTASVASILARVVAILYFSPSIR